VPAHQSGESIEGEKIYGHSRDPLRSQPVKKINGTKCFIFKAEFNVFAEILVGLTQGTSQIKENALKTVEETLGCDTALITTVARTRTPRNRDLFQNPVSKVTHTHGANEWEFKQQTNVKVVTPRQEIINALRKRNDSDPLLSEKI
jgi:hypothetical protein